MASLSRAVRCDYSKLEVATAPDAGTYSLQSHKSIVKPAARDASFRKPTFGTTPAHDNGKQSDKLGDKTPGPQDYAVVDTESFGPAHNQTARPTTWVSPGVADYLGTKTAAGGMPTSRAGLVGFGSANERLPRQSLEPADMLGPGEYTGLYLPKSVLHDATTLRNNRRRPGGESGARVVKEIPVPGAKPRGGGNKKKKTKKKHKGKLARKNSRKQRIADSTPSEPNPLAPTWGSAPRLGLAGFMRASRHPGTGGLGGLMEPDLPGPGAYTPKPYFHAFSARMASGDRWRLKAGEVPLHFSVSHRAKLRKQHQAAAERRKQATAGGTPEGAPERQEHAEEAARRRQSAAMEARAAALQKGIAKDGAAWDAKAREAASTLSIAPTPRRVEEVTRRSLSSAASRRKSASTGTLSSRNRSGRSKSRPSTAAAARRRGGGSSSGSGGGGGGGGGGDSNDGAVVDGTVQAVAEKSAAVAAVEEASEQLAVNTQLRVWENKTGTTWGRSTRPSMVEYLASSGKVGQPLESPGPGAYNVRDVPWFSGIPQSHNALLAPPKISRNDLARAEGKQLWEEPANPLARTLGRKDTKVMVQRRASAAATRVSSRKNLHVSASTGGIRSSNNNNNSSNNNGAASQRQRKPRPRTAGAAGSARHRRARAQRQRPATGKRRAPRKSDEERRLEFGLFRRSGPSLEATTMDFHLTTLVWTSEAVAAAAAAAQASAATPAGDESPATASDEPREGHYSSGLGASLTVATEPHEGHGAGTGTAEVWVTPSRSSSTTPITTELFPRTGGGSRTPSRRSQRGTPVHGRSPYHRGRSGSFAGPPQPTRTSGRPPRTPQSRPTLATASLTSVGTYSTVTGGAPTTSMSSYTTGTSAGFTHSTTTYSSIGSDSETALQVGSLVTDSMYSQSSVGEGDSIVTEKPSIASGVSALALHSESIEEGGAGAPPSSNYSEDGFEVDQ